jgi:hypothetical protein
MAEEEQPQDDPALTEDFDVVVLGTGAFTALADNRSARAISGKTHALGLGCPLRQSPGAARSATPPERAAG